MESLRFTRNSEAAIDVSSLFNLLLVASLSFLGSAQAVERVGDAAFDDSYQQHARAAGTLEDEILFLIETSPDEERLNLYWTYNQFLGAWRQFELLHAQVVVTVTADSSSQEEESRATLRDQARFALQELIQAEGDLERNIPELKRPGQLRMNSAIRELLREVRTTIGALLFEQCARESC